MILAHGGTPGLIAELASALAIGALLVWAAVRSRRDHERGDP